MSTTQGSPKVLRILLAEDNAEDVELAQEAFHDAGVTCILDVVSNGAEAVAHLLRQAPFDSAISPDIVLMDINMPIKNGFEALKEIRANRKTACYPVVMFTTSKSPDDITLAYQYGAASYIAKPSSYSALQDIATDIYRYWAGHVELPNRHR